MCDWIRPAKYEQGSQGSKLSSLVLKLIQPELQRQNVLCELLL